MVENLNENGSLELNKENSNTIIKCELCGFTFQKCDGISCNSCPINCKAIKYKRIFSRNLKKLLSHYGKKEDFEEEDDDD